MKTLQSPHATGTGDDMTKPIRVVCYPGDGVKAALDKERAKRARLQDFVSESELVTEILEAWAKRRKK